MIRLMKMLSVTACVVFLGIFMQCNKSSSNDSANNLLLYYLSTQRTGTVFLNACSGAPSGTCSDAYNTPFNSSSCSAGAGGTISTSQCNCSGAVGTCITVGYRTIYYSSNFTIASAQAQCVGNATWTINCTP